MYRIFYDLIVNDYFSFSAYSNCVSDPRCAANSVQGYMNRFGQVIKMDNFYY